MTLWVFGDSYANGYMEKPWFWSKSLANKLSTDIRNYGVPGSGLEFTYTEVQKYYKEFQSGDSVVVCLTQLHRQYFFVDNPKISIIQSFDNPFIVPKDIKRTYQKAFSLFVEKLYNENNSKVNLTNFLFFLQHLADTKGIKIIALSCFSDVDNFISSIKEDVPSIQLASGNLFSISENECASKDVVEVFYHYEARANHICKRNHTVLCDKLFDCLHTNNPINLTTGFHSKFMTRELSISKEFAEDEFLFPEKMTEVHKSNIFEEFMNFNLTIL